MKHISLLALFSLLYFSAYTQSYKKWQDEAEKEYNNNNFAKALVLSEKVIKEAEKDKKITKEDFLTIKSDHAVYLIANDKLEEGLTLFVNIINELETQAYKAETEINIRQNYGNSLHALTLYHDALPQLKKAYDLVKTTPYDKVKTANLIRGLAECCKFSYKFNESEQYYKEAISFCEKEKITGTIEYPSQFAGLAALYIDMQFHTRALNQYEIAEGLYIKNKDTLDTEFSIFLMNYGTFLVENYRFDEGMNRLFRAKNLYLKKFGEKSQEYAGILNNIGFAYSRMNKITETEQFYIKSIDIKKAIPNIPIGSYLTTVSNLMVFYDNLGRKEQAEELAEELEKALADKKLEDTLKRATFAQNLGEHYTGIKKYNKAQKYYSDAIMYNAAVYGSGNEFEYSLYVSKATLFDEEGNYDEAIKWYGKLNNTYESILKSDNLDNKLSFLISFINQLKKVNNHKMMDSVLTTVFKDISNIDNVPAFKFFYLEKALALSSLNKADEAIEYFTKYMELMYKELDQNTMYMTEQEKMAFMEKFEIDVLNFYTTILNFIDKKPELLKVLLNYRIKTKGILLNNVSKIKKKVYELNDPGLNKKFEQLKFGRDNISKLMSLNTEDYPEALNEIAALKKETDMLEKEISLKVSLSQSASKQNVYWRSIQKELQPNEAAIEVVQAYLDYENQGKGTHYSFIIIKNTGDPIHVEINRKIDWETEVTSLYRNSINSKKNDTSLYRRLWKFVDVKLSGVNSVYISPDGIFNQINLNTLYNTEAKKFLIEDKNLHYIAALRDIIDIKQNPSKKPTDAVLIGNPKFGYDLSSLPENKENFGNDLIASRGGYGFVLSELPGTKTEIETIKQQLEKNNIKTTLLAEEKANEAEVKKIKNPSVLHIATHGFFLEDFSEETLAQFSKIEQAYYKNPMMRSGIFFSGANNTYSLNTANINQLKDFEDGMLTAFEAMNLSLDKTELVILSACETGLGKVKNGEGVFGLQRAFKLAGAKSIIMSLWPVSDDATMELMVNLYNSWMATGDLYTSFKVAQMAVKTKYPEPYFWGAFVLNGR